MQKRKASQKKYCERHRSRRIRLDTGKSCTSAPDSIVIHWAEESLGVIAMRVQWRNSEIEINVMRKDELRCVRCSSVVFFFSGIKTFKYLKW